MSAGNQSILIVDDDEDIRTFLCDLLATDGYETWGAASGSEGIAEARRRKPDMVLLDIMMPELDGYEVCERLKADAATRDVPIVMVTVKNDIADIMRSLVTGATGFIVKPFDDESLLRTVKMIMMQRPFDPYSGIKPVVTNKISRSDLDPSKQVVFLNILEPGGRRSLFFAATETPGTRLLSLWQQAHDEGDVQSTAAVLTASSRDLDALLHTIADRPTAEILTCQVYPATVAVE